MPPFLFGGASGKELDCFASLAMTLMNAPPTAVVPANAGTHNPWRRLYQKVSTPLPKREDTAYGSLRLTRNCALGRDDGLM